MKVVSATQAKNHLGALIGSLDEEDEAVVIERHGHPRAVMISADEWTALVQAREGLRRLQAWERIRKLAEEVSARNADLTPEDAHSLADELANEAKRRVAERLIQR